MSRIRLGVVEGANSSGQIIIRSGADNNVIFVDGNFDGATVKVVARPFGDAIPLSEFELLPDPATFTTAGSVFIAGYRNIPLWAYLVSPGLATDVYVVFSGMG